MEENSDVVEIPPPQPRKWVQVWWIAFHIYLLFCRVANKPNRTAKNKAAVKTNTSAKNKTSPNASVKEEAAVKVKTWARCFVLIAIDAKETFREMDGTGFKKRLPLPRPATLRALAEAKEKAAKGKSKGSE